MVTSAKLTRGELSGRIALYAKTNFSTQEAQTRSNARLYEAHGL